MNARVLIIEDEAEISELIGLYLKNDGIHSVSCESGEAGQKEFEKGGFDLIVLDINLPGMDGFEFLHKVRKISKVPIVIVSSREADEDKVLGLGIGADDFVAKPFSPKVLVARIRAHLRRFFESKLDSAPLVRFGPFTLDSNGYSLKKGGKGINLPTKEFEVLNYLVSHSGAVRSVEQIYQDVWGEKYGDLATVAVHIQRLRKRLEAEPAEPYYIVTVYGAGYKFNSDALNREN